MFLCQQNCALRHWTEPLLIFETDKAKLEFCEKRLQFYPHTKGKTSDFGFDSGRNLACVTLKAEQKLLAKEIHSPDAEFYGCCGKQSYGCQKIMCVGISHLALC